MVETNILKQAMYQFFTVVLQQQMGLFYYVHLFYYASVDLKELVILQHRSNSLLRLVFLRLYLSLFFCSKMRLTKHANLFSHKNEVPILLSKYKIYLFFHAHSKSNQVRRYN